jgi:hypothetical protein
VALRVADVGGQTPFAAELARCLVLRRALGLPAGPRDPALIAGDGSALDAAGLTTWLRRARLVSLSLESNGGICRSLLRVRHGVPDPTEEAAMTRAERSHAGRELAQGLARTPNEILERIA